MSEEYKVEYTKLAISDLEKIYCYIANNLRSVLSAQKIRHTLYKAVNSLEFFPERHPLVDWEPASSQGVRKYPVKKYVIIYFVDKDNKIVTIYRVLYGKRKIDRFI